MVEYTEAGNKAELIAEIERARHRISGSLKGLQRDADIGAHLKHSFSNHKAAWLGGAGVAGWVLSRLPARKRKIKVVAGRHEDHKIKDIAEAGMMVSILKFILTLFRPAIVAFATRKISDLAAKHNHWQK